MKYYSAFNTQKNFDMKKVIITMVAIKSRIQNDTYGIILPLDWDTLDN